MCGSHRDINIVCHYAPAYTSILTYTYNHIHVHVHVHNWDSGTLCICMLRTCTHLDCQTWVFFTWTCPVDSRTCALGQFHCHHACAVCLSSWSPPGKFSPKEFSKVQETEKKRRQHICRPSAPGLSHQQMYIWSNTCYTDTHSICMYTWYTEVPQNRPKNDQKPPVCGVTLTCGFTHSASLKEFKASVVTWYHP